jgi:hypothetical protein
LALHNIFWSELFRNVRDQEDEEKKETGGVAHAVKCLCIKCKGLGSNPRTEKKKKKKKKKQKKKKEKNISFKLSIV